MNKAVCFILLFLFLADHASLYLSLHPMGFARQAETSSACNCTCCGDTCSMGAACCCAPDEEKPAQKPSGVRLLQEDCRPESPIALAHGLMFRSAWIVPKIESIHLPEISRDESPFVLTLNSTHTTTPPTPPPQA